LEKKIGELETKSSQLQQSITEFSTQLQQLSFDNSVYQKKEIEVEQKRNSLHLKELELKDLRFSQTTIQQDIRQIEEKIKENQLFQKQIVELEGQRKYLEKLDLIMSEFKLHLIGRIRPALSALTKSLMSEMTEGKYSELEVDQDYEIFIYDNGSKFGLERFSGGEKDLANLCLRLAISLLISQSAGTDFSFIVLDEIFGSQDQQRKENILKALGNLRNRFRQIILITHIDDIKDQVESLINVVENQDGTSRIETSLVYD
jgi:exonuclease SbcC